MASPRDAIFDERVKRYSDERTALYNAAVDALPEARAEERQPLLELLRLEPGVRVCDAMAGGGYVARGIREALADRCRVVGVEPSLAFAKSLRTPLRGVCSSLAALAFPDRSFDRVCNLAGTHHLANKRAFFAEAHRVLAPGGIFAVADVLEGSPPAVFLNTTVDTWSDIGHEAIFWRRGEMERMLADCGFVGVRERVERYTWNFPDRDAMVAFCQSLFRLTRATPDVVASELSKRLRVEDSPRGCHLEWMLLYACGERAA